MINVMLLNAILEDNKSMQDQIDAATAANIAKAQTCINACPAATGMWPCLPLMSCPTGTLLVCDTSGNYRCGACCLWTVPGGVTCAQFQIWGAGAGTTFPMCCGGTPFGGSGAYAVVAIPVVAGCQYTLCAGCAYCCYAQWCNGGCNTLCGCQSFVTGYGLSGFCAEGGTNDIYCNKADICGLGACANGYCTWGIANTTLTGPCICAGNIIYFFQSCATCGEIPVHKSPRNYYGSATGGTVYGVPGMHGGGCLDTNNYGYHLGPPVIGIDHQPFGSGGCTHLFTSEVCAGGCACTAVNGVQQFPAAGGFSNHVMGGGTIWMGDAGRMGMVRVTYK